jgi:hypothetical protein
MRLLALLVLASLALAALACDEEEGPDARSDVPGALQSPTLTSSPPLPTADISTPNVGDLRHFEDAGLGFALDYPAEWTIEEAAVPPGFDYILRALDFIKADGFRHASIVVMLNTEGLTLEDFIEMTNPAFFDSPVVPVTIAGAPGLFRDTWQGLPTAAAYVTVGDRVYSLSGMRMEEFEALTARLVFLGK